MRIRSRSTERRTIIVSPRRGEIWSPRPPHDDGSDVLIVSADVYNTVDDYPFVLVTTMTDGPCHPPITVQVGSRATVTDTIRRLPKAALAARTGRCTDDEVTQVANSLVRILTLD